jgi:hypothetical protein
MFVFVFVKNASLFVTANQGGNCARDESSCNIHGLAYMGQLCSAPTLLPKTKQKNSSKNVSFSDANI